MEFMRKDHDRLDNIFISIKEIKLSSLEKAKSLFIEFETGLLRHIVWEEEILFHSFEAETGMRHGGPTAVMRTEHQQIKGLLQQIRRKLEINDIQTEDEERSLFQILNSHNIKEETILYPWIDRTLGEETRQDMISKMTRDI
jgi:iron-sulfur cluster repair protein YtfE (RIC family)